MQMFSAVPAHDDTETHCSQSGNKCNHFEEMRKRISACLRTNSTGKQLRASADKSILQNALEKKPANTYIGGPDHYPLAHAPRAEGSDDVTTDEFIGGGWALCNPLSKIARSSKQTWQEVQQRCANSRLELRAKSEQQRRSRARQRALHACIC